MMKLGFVSCSRKFCMMGAYCRNRRERARGARLPVARRARPCIARYLDAGYRWHDLLKEWASQGQLTIPVIMMSGHATINTAVEATKIGALDFLEKPIALQ